MMMCFFTNNFFDILFLYGGGSIDGDIFVALIILFAGYAVYSKVVEKVFGANDERETPAYTVNDGMDYVPMSWWKGWVIQLLNIAGLGPVFGSILRVAYMTASRECCF